MTRAQANLVLLLAGVIWGMGFVAQSTAMATMGPLMFIGLRSITATLTVLPLAIIESRKAPVSLKKSDYAFFSFVGLLLFSGLCLQQIGLITTTVTNAGFLTGVYVVMVPVLGVMLFRHWPHPVIWPSALATLAGIFLLSGGHLNALQQGDWLIIAGAFFWALQVIFIGRANRTGRPIMLSCVQFATCAVAALGLAAMFGQFHWSGITDTWQEILFTGIFSSGAAFTLQAIGQRYTTAPQAAIFLSSEALFAALFGALILGDRLPPMGLLGCGLIFLAMLAVELLPMFWNRKRQPNAAHTPTL